MSDPVYIVGIDLGTTNTVVAYTSVAVSADRRPDIAFFDIPQTVAPGEVARQRLLPSFLMAPGPHDTPPGALTLPWGDDGPFTVGEFAKQRGAELPHRLISSSKSWLCSPLVDRDKPILPWNAPEGCPRLSPVAASARILGHVRSAWNHRMAVGADGQDTRRLLENQEIYLTVPASFDAVARELTVRAAREAGLSGVTLLEEPTAAFYAWIHDSGDAWREAVQEGDRVLVCDIGGGTSDFSMISVGAADGRLTLERVAVGSHLLVGGDNMDLALAHFLARKLSQSGTRIDTARMQSLWQNSRRAKEILLSGTQGDAVPITLLGRGGSLIGGSIRTELQRGDAEQVVVEGFFPACDRNAAPAAPAPSGLRELGLSYEADPAVTRHLAAFVRRMDRPGATQARPTAVLFNGGVMKAPVLQQRILSVLDAWAGDNAGAKVRALSGADCDLAVAKGAAYYGMALRGKGLRIRSGLSRSYYLAVAAAMPAVPGLPAPVKALCVAPFGMEEGTVTQMPAQTFILAVGEAATFELMGSLERPEDKAGEVVEDWADTLSPVALLETTLPGRPGAAVPVTIEVRLTEVGTLEVWCVAIEDGRRWKLEFNVREQER